MFRHFSQRFFSLKSKSSLKKTIIYNNFGKICFLKISRDLYRSIDGNSQLKSKLRALFVTNFHEISKQFP